MIADNIWYLTSFWYWMWSPLLLWMPTKVVWDFLCLSFFLIFFSFFLILFSFSAKSSFALLRTSEAIRWYSGLKTNDLKRTTLLGHCGLQHKSRDYVLLATVDNVLTRFCLQYGRLQGPIWPTLKLGQQALALISTDVPIVFIFYQFYQIDIPPYSTISSSDLCSPPDFH